MQPGDADTKELILFYNVENLFTPDKKPAHRLDPTISGLRNWDNRKYQDKILKIARVLSFIEEEQGILPMLVGLSEIYGKKPLEDLVALAPFNSHYGFVHYESMDERGVDVALLYDKTKIEVLHSEPISFFFEIEDNNPANYDTTRDVLYCKIKYEGSVINVFVFHLPSKREKDINKPKRDFILKEIHEKILELREAHEAVLICGDFNENPNETNLQSFLQDKNFNKILTNPFQELYTNKIFSTFHREDGLVFDQIIFSDEFFKQKFPLRFQNATVYRSQKISSTDKKFLGRPYRTYAGTRYLGGYSDHFPVFIIFSKNKEI